MRVALFLVALTFGCPEVGEPPDIELSCELLAPITAAWEVGPNNHFEVRLSDQFQGDADLLLDFTPGPGISDVLLGLGYIDEPSTTLTPAGQDDHILARDADAPGGGQMFGTFTCAEFTVESTLTLALVRNGWPDTPSCELAIDECVRPASTGTAVPRGTYDFPDAVDLAALTARGTADGIEFSVAKEWADPPSGGFTLIWITGGATDPDDNTVFAECSEDDRDRDPTCWVSDGLFSLASESTVGSVATDPLTITMPLSYNQTDLQIELEGVQYAFTDLSVFVATRDDQGEDVFKGGFDIDLEAFGPIVAGL